MTARMCWAQLIGPAPLWRVLGRWGGRGVASGPGRPGRRRAGRPAGGGGGCRSSAGPGRGRSRPARGPYTAASRSLAAQGDGRPGRGGPGRPGWGRSRGRRSRPTTPPLAPAEGWAGRDSGAAPLLARRPPGRGCGRARAHSPDTRRSTSHAAGARRRGERSGVSGSVAGSGRIGSASDDLLKARGAPGRDGPRPPRPHCSPGQNGGSSLNSPLPPLALPLPVARSGLAVAHRSEGPTSSAWTSTTLRRSPSGVSQERARS
jgi:hypothetical protein